MAWFSSFTMAVLLLLLVSLCLFAWACSLQAKLKRQQKQIRSTGPSDLSDKSPRGIANSNLAKSEEEGQRIIANAQEQGADYTKTARRIADSNLAKAREESAQLLSEAQEKANHIIENAKTESARLREKIKALRAEAKTVKEELDNLSEGLALKADDAHLLEVGYYEPVYGFEDLEQFQQAIEKVKDHQKAMLRSLSGMPAYNRSDFQYLGSLAIFVWEEVTYNGSRAEGEKLLIKVQKLMLRAFNGECDTFIARVNYRNFDAMKKRIKSALAQINKIGMTWHCEITSEYANSRLEELQLVYEYCELQEKIKREQTSIREQMREEAKASQEAERETSLIEAEKAKYEQQLAAEKDKVKIRELQKVIEELTSKARAISQAQLTRSGHVYILSNVGSFGEGVFKIGMTRRLEPSERVRELGDASVPFPFDVHAMIPTKDAPTLEKALHNHFSDRRLNLENERKEFFRITIQEIREELHQIREDLGIDSEMNLTLLAEAREFRISEARRVHFEESSSNHSAKA